MEEEGISYLDIVQESYAHLFQQFHRIIRPLAFYFICSLIIFFLGDGRLQTIQSTLSLLDVLLLLCYSAVGMVITVHWKRWLLLGDERLFHARVYVKLIGTVLWWLIPTILIYALVSIVAAVLAAVGAFIWAYAHGWNGDQFSILLRSFFVPTIAVILVLQSVWLVRTFLVITSVTMDDPWSVRRIWRMTKGHYWRMLMGGLATWTPSVIAGIIFTVGFISLSKAQNPVNTLLLTIVSSLVQGMLAFIPMGYSAFLYRELKKEYERKTV